jgi:hypothetical protein
MIVIYLNEYSNSRRDRHQSDQANASVLRFRTARDTSGTYPDTFQIHPDYYFSDRNTSCDHSHKQVDVSGAVIQGYRGVLYVSR